MPRKPVREDPANLLPWPKDPPHGWPPGWPWPPEFPVNALGQKKCIERCLANGGSLAACAIMCAIIDGVPMTPSGAGPTASQGGGSVRDALLAIDDDIIEELKEVAQHRANAVAELERAASQRAQGNVAEADALTRSAERENAKAHEIEIEIRGKERAKRKVQLFR